MFFVNPCLWCFVIISQTTSFQKAVSKRLQLLLRIKIYIATGGEYGNLNLPLSTSPKSVKGRMSLFAKMTSYFTISNLLKVQNLPF
jgi:hypothetical protein